MAVSSKAFGRAVSTMRSAIRRRARRSGRVSPVDISSVAKNVKGDIRGAAVSAAFNQLVSEGVIAPSQVTVYNPSTHHRVTVYTAS